MSADAPLMFSVRDVLMLLSVLVPLAGMWIRMEVRSGKLEVRLDYLEKAVNGGGRSGKARMPRKEVRTTRR